MTICTANSFSIVDSCPSTELLLFIGRNGAPAIIPNTFELIDCSIEPQIANYERQRRHSPSTS